MWVVSRRCLDQTHGINDCPSRNALGMTLIGLYRHHPTPKRFSRTFVRVLHPNAVTWAYQLNISPLSLIPPFGQVLTTAARCFITSRSCITTFTRIFLRRKGFFTLYRNLFLRLAHDESQVCNTLYPSFGYSTWRWVSLSGTIEGEESVKAFYKAWSNFHTSKEFSWLQWDLTEAPDRRTRRCY